MVASTGRVRRNMQNLRDKKLFIDFEIRVDNLTFSTHKFLLASYSDYFRAMLTNDSIESQEGKVYLHDITAAAMSAVLDYCYGSNLNLNHENVQEILIASSILQIDEIQDHCVNFIKKNVDESNCLGVMVVAYRCNLPELFNCTLHYCLDRFEKVIEENEFLDLDEEWLSTIISDCRLNVSGEDKVFQTVIDWISAKPGREEKLESLMTHIRLPLLEPKKLIEISDHELVRKSMTCRDLTDEAKNFLLLESRSNNLEPEIVASLSKFQIAGPRFQRRLPLRSMSCIYAVGGWTNEKRPLHQVEKYSPETDHWVELEPIEKARCGVGVTILGNSLYAIGGHDGKVYLKCVERFDITNETWFSDVADMNFARTSIGVVSLGGYIYAIGGQMADPNPDRIMRPKVEATSKVERYDRLTNTWEECAPMLEKRLGAGVTILNGLIYVTGGADTSDALNTVECYDPATDRWTYKAPMSISRKHHGCTTYAGKIYAVGGRHITEWNDAECYDPESNTWRPICPLNKKRSGFGLVVLDDLIFAIGGYNGDASNTVETYNSIERRWTMKTPMLYDRLGCGLAAYSPLMEYNLSDK